MTNSEDITFEDLRNDNGSSWWWATDLMSMLGYDDWDKFEKVINQAIKACMSLGNVKYYENFIATTRNIAENEVQDFKLTRFACYLIGMNGDSNIPQVAQAQAYFVEQTRKFEIYLQEHDIERLAIREELKEGFKSLSSSFTQAGGSNYASFNDAGIMGMYNSKAWQLAKQRQIDKNHLYNHMGRQELAANLFRVTQTEARIDNQKIKGQRNLEQTHYDVGKQVRNFVIENTGKRPEQLPQERKLPEIQSELKQGYKKMSKEIKNPSAEDKDSKG